MLGSTWEERCPKKKRKNFHITLHLNPMRISEASASVKALLTSVFITEELSMPYPCSVRLCGHCAVFIYLSFFFWYFQKFDFLFVFRWIPL